LAIGVVNDPGVVFHPAHTAVFGDEAIILVLKALGAGLGKTPHLFRQAGDVVRMHLGGIVDPAEEKIVLGIAQQVADIGGDELDRPMLGIAPTENHDGAVLENRDVNCVHGYPLAWPANYLSTIGRPSVICY